MKLNLCILSAIFSLGLFFNSKGNCDPVESPQFYYHYVKFLPIETDPDKIIQMLKSLKLFMFDNDICCVDLNYLLRLYTIKQWESYVFLTNDQFDYLWEQLKD